MLFSALAALVAGAIAGCLGSLLGLGGGFILVPFFQLAFGMEFGHATGVSLVTVIGNSMAVSLSPKAKTSINFRLGLVLQILTIAGATTGVWLLTRGIVSEAASKRVFGVVAALVGLVLMVRLDKRNVIDADAGDLGAFGGQLDDPDTGRTMSYKLKRLPVALGSSFTAGIVSSLAGIGGGVVIVPALNALCGIPIRVAAATSTFILGATAMPGALGKFPFGEPFATEIAAAAVIGALAGSKFGLWLSGRVRVRAMKILLALIMFALAVKYLTGWRS